LVGETGVQPFTVGMMEYVIVSVVNPEFEIVSRISPVPVGEYPERFGELAVAVRLNTVDGTVEVSRILVVSPEQIDGVVELISTSGSGSTEITMS